MIHPTAVISPEAELGSNVEVGPHVIVGPRVKVGAGTKLIGSCVVMGPTILGEANEVRGRVEPDPVPCGARDLRAAPLRASGVGPHEPSGANLRTTGKGNCCRASLHRLHCTAAWDGRSCQAERCAPKRAAAADRANPATRACRAGDSPTPSLNALALASSARPLPSNQDNTR